jgi:hypothetical protein
VNFTRCFKSFALGIVLLSIAAASSARGDGENDLSVLVAAQQAHPGDMLAKRAVENAVCAGLPNEMPAALPSSLPVDATAAPDDLGTLIAPKPYLVTQAAEPQQGLNFAKITYLYRTADDGQIQQFCRIHYTLPDDSALAGRIARLLSLANRTLVQETGRPPVGGDAPFDVWLCRSGQAGGEQWGRNIYFYDLDAPRSSIEWIREVVHEYSHLALPPIGGYTAPEYWANGYLGERLIVRWFQRIPDGPAMVGRAWGDFSGAGNFDRLLVTPALDLYHKVGPNPKWLARTDADGMRYLIGQALAIDDKYGGRRIGDIFALIPLQREAKAADWGYAVRQATPRHAVARRP